MSANYQWKTKDGKFKSGFTKGGAESVTGRISSYCAAHGIEQDTTYEPLVSECPFALAVEDFIKRNVRRANHPTALELWDECNWTLILARQKVEVARYDELLAGGKQRDGKQLCQLHTPRAIVEELFEAAGAYDAETVLVPGAGDGSFSFFAAQRNSMMDTLVEIDTSMMDGLHDAIGESNIRIINADFLKHNFGGYKPELVIGNPPFTANGKAERGDGVHPLWVDFLEAAARLEPKRIAFILPSSWKNETAQWGKRVSAFLSVYGCIYNRGIAMKSEWRSVGRPCSVVVFERGTTSSFGTELESAAYADGEKLSVLRLGAEGQSGFCKGLVVGDFHAGFSFQFDGIALPITASLGLIRYYELAGKRYSIECKVVKSSGCEEFFASKTFAKLRDACGNNSRMMPVKTYKAINLEFARNGWRKYENKEAS